MRFKTVYCEDTEETIYNYNQYLRSKHWNILKAKFKYSNHSKKECKVCKDRTNLHVHHLDYKCLGKETFSDIIYLCKKCHG